MNNYNEPSPTEREQRQIDELIMHASQRVPESVRNLNKDHGNKQYQDVLAKEPLVKKMTHGGAIEEGITHLIIAGDTVMGLSREVNMLKVGSGSNPVERVRLAVLPLGRAGGDTGTAHTLLDVRPADLRKRGADGVMKGWEELEIGRDLLAAKTGSNDPSVSSSHLAVAIGTEGHFGVFDLDSTNGTQIVSVEDFYNQQGRGLDEPGRQALLGVVERLQQDPHMWEAESADRQVINPYM